LADRAGTPPPMSYRSNKLNIKAVEMDRLKDLTISIRASTYSPVKEFCIR
jgi:hypothetical protein